MRTLAALCLLVMACSLAPDPAPTPRYFAPAAPDPLPAAAPEAAPLVLRKVTAARHLGERIAWRSSDVEYGYYELLRWTAMPSDYLEGSLERVLFQGGRFERASRSGVPVLSVRLERFEELRGSERGVSLAFTAVLEGAAGGVVLDRRFEGTGPLSGDDPAGIARALGTLTATLLQELVEAMEATGGAGG